MKLNSTSLLVVGLALVVGLNEVHSQVTKDDRDAKECARADLAQLLWADDSQQVRILQDRKTLIDQLVSVIDAPENHAQRPEAVMRAMQTLGSFRAVEGIDVLTEYIGFPWVHHPRAGEYPVPKMFGAVSRIKSDRTPAVEALVEIGEPSVPKVIAKLAETESVLEQVACRAVLRRLDERVRVREALQKAIERAEDKKAKRNLEDALGEITAK